MIDLRAYLQWCAPAIIGLALVTSCTPDASDQTIKRAEPAHVNVEISGVELTSASNTVDERVVMSRFDDQICIILLKSLEYFETCLSLDDLVETKDGNSWLVSDDPRLGAAILVDKKADNRTVKTTGTASVVLISDNDAALGYFDKGEGVDGLVDASGQIFDLPDPILDGTYDLLALGLVARL